MRISSAGWDSVTVKCNYSNLLSYVVDKLFIDIIGGDAAAIFSVNSHETE